MSLTKKTMIATLNIKMLGMAGKAWRLTRQIHADINATNDSGFYQKCKIDRASVSQIIKTTEHARAVHKRLTRPFSDNGDRLLPATRVNEYTREMRAAKQDFVNAVMDLEARWPAVIAKQHARMARSKKVMFVPSDYPYVKTDGNGGYIIEPNVDLKKFYKFDFELKPSPDEGHIVIELENETIDEIKAHMKRRQRKNLEASKLELWKRLMEPVKNMADICSNDKKVFKSLIANIEKELDILKDLNVTNDIDMANVLNDVKAQLTGYTPGQIRDDKRLKTELGKKAGHLSDVMSAYMGNGPN